MKIKTLITLLLCSAVYAQHPRDFIADDAFSVLSIKDGNAINSVIETVYEEIATSNAKIKYLDTFLTEFFDDPTAVDLSSELLLVVEPTILVKGQQQAGLFGPIPHMQIICKAKEGRTLTIKNSSWLKSSTTVDGWFIASGAESIVVRKEESLSSIFNSMPDTQAGWVIRFKPLWQQFGPIAQMMGGIYIGSMNKPDLNGVISKQQRSATAAARNAFKELTAWCSTAGNISIGVDIEDFVLLTTIEIESKETTSFTIDNASMLAMSSYFNDSVFQCAMSGDFTRMLLNIDEHSFDLIAPFASVPAPILASSMRLLAVLAEVNVLSCDLNLKNGLTLSALVDTHDQSMYLKEAPTAISLITKQLLDDFQVELSEAKTPNTWDVSMIGSDDDDQNALNAMVHPGGEFLIAAAGDERVAMAFGPKDWRVFGSPRSTTLTQVISKHSKRVEIDMALVIDFRSLAIGFAEIAKETNPDDLIVFAQTPSAKCSLLYGSTTSGIFVEAKLNVIGLANLYQKWIKLK